MREGFDQLGFWLTDNSALDVLHMVAVRQAGRDAVVPSGQHVAPAIATAMKR